MVVRVAVIGCGSWGINHVRSARRLKGAELAAVCDASEASLNRALEVAPGVKSLKNPDEVFRDPSIDAVIIATPAVTHAPLARAAVEANKHALVEKPFVLQALDGQPIVDEAERRGRVLMVGHVLRYHPYFRLLTDMVARGELGDIHYAYAQRVNLGTVRSDENAFWSLAVHDLSMMCAILQGEPTEIAVTGKSFLRPGIEDVVFATVQFSNGTLGHIHVSWLDPQKRRAMTVVGSKKMAVFDDMEPNEKLRIYDKGVQERAPSASFDQFLNVRDGDVHIPYVKMNEPVLLEQQHFVDCIRDGKTPETDGREAMRVMKCLAAATESLKDRGRPVAIAR
ncbi:MAG: Gfo/Idh/MocA family oxidoreductase [Deltaproteobacteria bacterium]|nr:Gfo/Idh/MocA family oxidoreductase [Deltaproteobacteria bacterium]